MHPVNEPTVVISWAPGWSSEWVSSIRVTYMASGPVAGGSALVLGRQGAEKSTGRRFSNWKKTPLILVI